MNHDPIKAGNGRHIHPALFILIVDLPQLVVALADLFVLECGISRVRVDLGYPVLVDRPAAIPTTNEAALQHFSQ